MNRRAMLALKRAVLLLAAPVALTACSAEPEAQPPLAGAQIGGEFTLIDKDSKTVRWSDFDGSWRTIYFGYTFCPDACPLDMGVLMKGFRQFENAHPDLAAKVQPLFVSIDPARDGPEQVGQFGIVTGRGCCALGCSSTITLAGASCCPHAGRST